MSGYRRVRVAGDELVHFAATDTDRAIGCARAVVAALVLARNDRPRCGPCVVNWLVATDQIRLVTRLRTVLPPELDPGRRTLDL